MDQNEIDALMNNAPDPDDGSDNSLAPGRVGQEDIDAPMTGIGGEGPSGQEEALSGAEPAAREADGGVGFDQADIEALMAGAGSEFGMDAADEQQESTSVAKEPDLPFGPVDLPDFERGTAIGSSRQPVSLLHDVQLHVKIELGRTRMFVEDVLRLASGSVVELNRLAGDPVDVYVNDRLVARGEVLVLGDNFCVRVSEIMGDPDSQVLG